jgi:hypothetical protein
VGVTPLGASALELLPLHAGARANRWAFIIPGIVSAVSGVLLLAMTCLTLYCLGLQASAVQPYFPQC